MQALVYQGPRDLRLEELPEPEPAAGEVLVTVAGCGVCGSDLHGFLGHSSARRPPLVLGHEIAGTVTAVGEGVADGLLGATVSVNPLLTCGECEFCAGGQDNRCAAKRLLGMDAPGGFAERLAIPQRNVVPVRSPLPVGGTLVEVLANALHVVGAASGARSIAIAGGGAVGLMVLAVSRSAGIPVRLLTEPQETRRERALSTLGATATADPRVGSLVELAREHGGVDVAVDAVGSTAARRDAIEAVRPGGRVVVLGLEEETSEIQFADLIRREVSLVGAFAYSRKEFRKAAALLETMWEDLQPLIATEPLREGKRVFDALADRRDARVKVVLTP